MQNVERRWSELPPVGGTGVSESLDPIPPDRRQDYANALDQRTAVVNDRRSVRAAPGMMLLLPCDVAM